MPNICLNQSCSKPVSNIFCSSKCFNEHKNLTLLNAYFNGEWDGSQPKTGFISKIVKNYILARDNYYCTKCGFNKLHPVDNKPVVEVNHIDGNSSNHKEENLETLCPNCHSLTDNYRARNTGFGSIYRRNGARKYNAPDYVPAQIIKKVYYCSCGAEKTRLATHCRPCLNKIKTESGAFYQADIAAILKRAKTESYNNIAKDYGSNGAALRKYLKSKNITLPKKHGNKTCPECGVNVIGAVAPYYCEAHKPNFNIEWPEVDEVVSLIKQFGVKKFMADYNIEYVSTVRKFLARKDKLDGVNLSVKYLGV